MIMAMGTLKWCFLYCHLKFPQAGDSPLLLPFLCWPKLPRAHPGRLATPAPARWVKRVARVLWVHLTFPWPLWSLTAVRRPTQQARWALRLPVDFLRLAWPEIGAGPIPAGTGPSRDNGPWGSSPWVAQQGQQGTGCEKSPSLLMKQGLQVRAQAGCWPDLAALSCLSLSRSVATPLSVQSSASCMHPQSFMGPHSSPGWHAQPLPSADTKAQRREWPT